MELSDKQREAIVGAVPNKGRVPYKASTEVRKELVKLGLTSSGHLTEAGWKLATELRYGCPYTAEEAVVLENAANVARVGWEIWLTGEYASQEDARDCYRWEACPEELTDELKVAAAYWFDRTWEELEEQAQNPPT